MNEKLDKDVFEVHMKNIYSLLEKLTDNTTKLFEKQDEMNVTLAKNTVVVREHHIRSTRLEEVQEQMLLTIQNINHEIRIMKIEMKDLDKEMVKVNSHLKPIQDHVGKVNTGFQFFSNLPKIIKWVAILIVSISAIMGVINGTAQISDLVKFMMK